MMDLNSLVGLLCATVACLVVLAVKRVYFSPLSRFPGPKWAALTLWNEFYWDVIKRGTFIWKIEEMHEKYGPIVRINPYEIHILDPEFYDDLYMMNKLDKYEWWTKLAGADDSTFSTVPHDLHRLRRSAIAPFFSVRSVAQLEPLIRGKVEKLSNRFETIAATGEVVRLDAAFMALTMDITCDYSFSRDRKYLDEPDFKLEWKQTLIEAFEGGALARQFPWIQPAMKSLPLWFVKIAVPPLGSFFSWRNLVEQQVQPILNGTDSTTVKKEDGSRTVFHALRDSNLPPQEKTLNRFCDEGEILTGAGSETTSQVLTRLAFYLRHVPEVLVKLRQELDVFMAQTSGTPSLAELQKLPYLTAVIKEGLRLSYGTTTRLPRICHEDIHYKGYTIPAGTPLSQTSYFILVHPEIFPEPNTFRPERWLDQNENRRLDKYLVSFGKGSRQCLGMNLAYAELYITLSTIMTRFDWEMYETTLDDIVCKHDFFVAVGDLNSKGVRAHIKIRKS